MCIIWKSCYMLLHTGFSTKPCMVRGDHHSPTSPASLHVLPWLIKVRKGERKLMPSPMPALIHLINLSHSSLSHHVNVAPLTPPCTLVPSLAKRLHGIGQTSRAQTRQKMCQARGERALACLWTRQSTPRPVALVLLSLSHLARTLITPPATR